MSDFDAQVMNSVKKYMNIDLVIKEIKEICIKDVKQNIEIQSPELFINFNEIYKELTLMMKNFEKTINTIEKKVKKLVESSTLTNDVYQIRDEMKVIKSKLNKLSINFKNFSKIGELLSEE